MADEPDAKGAEGAEGVEESKKKSKMLLFIILGVVIVLLGGGGFFAYTKFLAPKPAEEGAEEIVPEIPQDIVGEMLMLEPFVVNLSDPKGKRYLKLKIGLELETIESLERVDKARAKLRDLVIVMLTSLTFDEVMTPEGKVQIRDELLERFNQATKPDRVKAIYFTEFVVQ